MKWQRPRVRECKNRAVRRRGMAMESLWRGDSVLGEGICYVRLSQNSRKISHIHRKRGMRMRFRRRALLLVSLAALLAGLSRMPPAAQTGVGQAAPAPAAARCRARKSPAGLYAAAGQAGQGDRAQPHPQHSGHCRIDLGHRCAVAAAGYAGARPGWRAGRRKSRAGDGFREWSFSPPSCYHRAGQPAAGLDRAALRAGSTGSACRGGAAGLATRQRRWG